MKTSFAKFACLLPVLSALILAAAPVAAQRGITTRPMVPTGPAVTPPVPVTTMQPVLGGSLPAPQTPTLSSGMSPMSGIETGVSVSSGSGDGSGGVIDDEARAFDYLERNGARVDPVESAPILEKMRRVRK